LVYLMVIWNKYPVLVCCTKKNLAPMSLEGECIYSCRAIKSAKNSRG
jgi:hypothetical protein